MFGEIQKQFQSLDLPKRRRRLEAVELGRLGFLWFLLIGTLGFQIYRRELLATDVVLPLYVLLGASFVGHFFYAIGFEWALKKWWPTVLVFAADALLVTLLIHFTGVAQSIFIFLYLVNIIFSGFMFHRAGAVSLALLTSTLYSGLLILNPDSGGDALVLSLGLNNIGFFLVAFLSGILSEQLSSVGRDLAQLRDLHRLILDNVASGLVTVSPESRIVQSNSAAAKILGRTILEGQFLSDLIPGLRVDDFANWSPHRANRFEIPYTTPNGEGMILGFSVSALQDQDTRRGYILIFQDLTEFKRLEMALRRQEKLAAVGQLAAGIAHEIRNPLAGISGSVELLKAIGHAAEGTEEYRLMNIVVRESQRLSRLIGDFLNFVRPDQFKFETLDMELLVRESLDTVKMNPQLRQGVVHDIQVESHKPVTIDRDKMVQVLLNLFINAYHAMEKTPEPRLSVRIREEAGQLVLRIQDNGMGMAPETLKRLFQPFHTTKPKGTGLGLATVHKILENFEARIHVESELGKGSEFIIEFPLMSMHTQVQPEKQQDAAQPSRRGAS